MTWLRLSLGAACLCGPVLAAACFSVPDVDLVTDGSSGTGDAATNATDTPPATTNATDTPPTTTATDGDTDPVMTTAVDSTGDEGVCGDGAVNDAETCDDANTTDGDGCDASCAPEPGFTCRGEPSACASTCSDGVIASDEICDDGNNFDGDGCTGCEVDAGYECSGNESSTCTPICGDSLLVGDETCDDGDTMDGNGCSAQCVVERYYRCVNTGPGSCTRIRLLFAPADGDDNLFRNATANITGGVVDFFDASGGTPVLPELTANYDCILTYPNGSYSDGPLFGSHLANFVDFGGNVVLGIATGFPMAGLGGTPIMDDGYSPIVANTGLEFLRVPVSYAGDGTSVIVDGVMDFSATSAVDTNVVLQGAGLMDGTYDNGTIAIAHRPDFGVIYLNGTGADAAGNMGEWPLLSANACAAGFLQ